MAATSRSRWVGLAPKAAAIGAVLTLVALLVFGLTTQAPNEQIDQSLADGMAAPAPSFDLPILQGAQLPPALAASLQPALGDDQVDLDELRGVPVVLNLWASWCDPCRTEAPVLNRGWERHGPRGVLYLGLNMQDATGDALGFLDEFEVRYPSVREQGNDVARSYGATGLPETYFISARGQVVAHVIGVVSDRQLDEGSAAAKAGRVAGTLTGGARREQR